MVGLDRDPDNRRGTCRARWRGGVAARRGNAAARRVRCAVTDARFRWDIEGLRGLAVAGVVLFHARVPGFRGGYVGVDVFFVISGYLITRLLLRDLERGRGISFARFYARRVRRLLPSATVVIIGVLVASSVILAPLTVRRVTSDGVASTSFFANLRFATQATNYFAARTGPSPFLHFWSLSLEEQFYLVWPTLLLVASGRRALNRRRVTGALALLFVVSLLASILLTHRSQPWAFYSLPSRAWEFTIGGALALWVTGPLPAMVGRTATWLGLGLIVISTALFSPTTPFPGWIAVVPVLGTAAIIAGGTAARSPAGLVLSVGPLPWLGRRSYVLYLWHFPLLVLIPELVGHGLSLSERLLICVGAVLLAEVTHRLVEEPVRSSRWLIERPRRGLVAGAGLVAVTAVVSTVVLITAPSLQGTGAAATAVAPISAADVQQALTASLETRAVPRNLAPALGDVLGDVPRDITDGCNDGFPDTALPGPRCTYGDRGSPTRVVLLGDSHAGQWFPALEAISRRHHWALIPMTKSSCPAPTVSFFEPIFGRAYDECDVFRRNALARIRQLKPDLVVFASSRGYGAAAQPAVWERGYVATITAIRGAAKSVVVIGDSPFWPSDPPSCVSAHLQDVRPCNRPRASAVDDAHTQAEARAARATGARFVDPTPWYCTRAGCPMVVGNLLVYRDTNHFTTPFARWLTTVFEQAVTAH
jgi:peptidoglycan/LPS O-acetylase OafA/YrhL